MGIEERIDILEQENKKLEDRVSYLEAVKTDKFVTPKQLAEIMDCSTNHVYILIREKKIQATHLGSSPKIPMSQFYDKHPSECLSKNKKKNNNPSTSPSTMKDIVFG